MDKIKNQNSAEDNGVPHYCESFDKELNYKLWITAGTRFLAGERLKRKAYLSSLAVNFCSGYVILFSLFSIIFSNIFLPSYANYINEFVAFVSITLSLFIIIFSQAESNSQYELQADKYHSCGLEISKLYKKLRFLKDNKEKNIDFLEKVYEISVEYDKVLSRFENHKNIDFLMAKLNKPDYHSHEMTEEEKNNIKKEYKKEFTVYWAVIIIPIIAFILFILTLFLILFLM